MSPTIAPQYNLKANSKIDFTHWRHLIVDVQKDMCDPARSLEKFDSGCFDFNESRAETFRRTKALEDVAHSINNFVSQSRSQLRPVWVCYSVPEYAEPTYENHRFYQNQTEPHVIERQENETLLLKSQASVVPENESFFNQSREDGVEGFVVSGMYASACVYESAVHLMKKGFKVAVAADLVGDHQPETLPAALLQLQKAGAVIIGSGGVLAGNQPISERSAYAMKSSIITTPQI